ncbi:MAG: hypothetical protein OSB83_13730 [Planctomycetota bacterium]|jgi:hypothetical protein|nr:hypothetical protein [Planctomycetota bacterium]HBO52717.1 hypothetical protein [Planctomycetota bacterium]|tara:strand:+ start:548 stop:802 length:255 start_codon:yes stop_codon:yes gene_type:complete
MKTFFGSLAVLLLVTTFAPAQDSTVKAVLDRYAGFRPATKDLAMYRIDWAPSLEEAQKRARREKRPVFLVIIHAQYGDLASGHC